MQTDPQLEVMAEIAVPLDEWCEYCNMKMAVHTSADGVKACDDCARQVIEAMAKYEREAAEAAFAAAKTPRGRHTSRSSKAAKARAKRRAKRKRTGR